VAHGLGKTCGDDLDGLASHLGKEGGREGRRGRRSTEGLRGREGAREGGREGGRKREGGGKGTLKGGQLKREKSVMCMNMTNLATSSSG
jgi:hypothetical protein